LQHRGQDSFGIVTAPGKIWGADKKVSSEIGNMKNVSYAGVKSTIGNIWRTGNDGLQSINGFSLCFEGKITNRREISKDVSDIEIIRRLIDSDKSMPSQVRLANAMRQIDGAASVIVLFGDMLTAARDAWGMKPLVMGRTGDGATVFASEIGAFYTIGAKFVREVLPGEVVYVRLKKNARPQSAFIDRPAPERFCVFEDIYRSLPNAVNNGVHVERMRRRFGEEAAKDFTHEIDMVVPVPNSGISVAKGAAYQLGKPLEHAILRSGFCNGRSFSVLNEESRKLKIRMKFMLDHKILDGKRILVADDSIVRGDVAQRLARMLYEGGAREVHWMSSCPMIKWPCFYGTGESNPERLICTKFDTPKAIAAELKIDSVTLLSLDGLDRVLEEFGLAKKRCTACFSGIYDVPTH
jgi:amidophosphoribosyltransferase